MSKMKLKLMLAGVLVASAFGAIAVGIAWATPSSAPGTITPTVISGPVVLDAIDVKIEDEDYELELRTDGLSDARVVHFRVTPGGFFGWHTHPGPVFVMVTAGTLTYYAADAADGVDYEAGTGFVDAGGGHVHDARNHGDVDVELVAFFLTPLGTPIRIDAPAP
ncbi:MAG TPA: cupin domain-containing protein [Pirellulaceae bacterium]|nr:cupin domain-containing protein [Pirellulaceae bacterium]